MTEKKKMGRPTDNPKDVRITVRLDAESADILKKAMIEIDNIFTKENIKSKMLLQVHDELIFNVYNDEIDKVKEIVKDTMENTYKLSVPLKVSINTGNNWYEAK